MENSRTFVFTVTHEDLEEPKKLFIRTSTLTAAWDKIQSSTLDGKRYRSITFDEEVSGERL